GGAGRYSSRSINSIRYRTGAPRSVLPGPLPDGLQCVVGFTCGEYLAIPASCPVSPMNLLRDILLMLGRNAFLAPFLNKCKPMIEGVHVAWRSAFAFQSCISFCPRCRDSFSATGFIIAKYWQSRKIL